MKWRAPDTSVEIEAFYGLRHDEAEVMDSLVRAVERFAKLEEQHPNDTHEFYSAIHTAQDLLAVRIARRLYPEGWPTHG